MFITSIVAVFAVPILVLLLAITVKEYRSSKTPIGAAKNAFRANHSFTAPYLVVDAAEAASDGDTTIVLVIAHVGEKGRARALKEGNHAVANATGSTSEYFIINGTDIVEVIPEEKTNLAELKAKYTPLAK